MSAFPLQNPWSNPLGSGASFKALGHGENSADGCAALSSWQPEKEMQSGAEVL